MSEVLGVESVESASDLPLCINQEHVLVARALISAGRLDGLHTHERQLLDIKLIGRLDVEFLEAALSQLIARHSGLRSVIRPNPRLSQQDIQGRLMMFGATGLFEPGVQFRQTIAEPRPLHLVVVDLSRLESRDAHQQLRICAAAATSEAGGDATERLSAQLLKLEPELHILLLAVDHIVSDAWSLQVIRSELQALYESILNNDSPPAPPRLQFHEYAAWEHERLMNSHYDRALAYWREQWVQLAPHRMGHQDLPFALPTSNVRTPYNSSEDLLIDLRETYEIIAGARRLRVTLHTLFVTAVGVVLSGYTGRQCIPLWAHFANRGIPGTKGAVGFFVHTHLLGVNLEADPTVQELLARVQKCVVSGIEHAELPLPVLWNTLQSSPRYWDARILVDCSSTRQSSTVPLTTQTPRLAFSLAGIARHTLHRRFSDLGVYVSEREDGINLNCQFWPEAFPNPAIRDLLSDVHSLALLIVRQPASKVSDLAVTVARYPLRLRRTAGLEMSQFTTLASGLRAATCLNGESGDGPIDSISLAESSDDRLAWR